MILLSDRRISAIALGDTGEPMIDLREVPELRIDSRLADPAGAYAHLREGVAQRLLDAQRALPDGLRLLVDRGVPAAAPADRRTSRTTRPSCGPPTRTGTPSGCTPRRASTSHRPTSPRTAPAARVDLTLCTDDGTGARHGHRRQRDARWTAPTPASRRRRTSPRRPASTGTCCALALSGVGLVNYPTEWWHWSYGDRYWALQTRAAQTRYGPVASV